MLALRSALRSGQSIRERWSATCSFDVGDQLHTFSACTLRDSAAAAQESLAQQLTQQDVCWRLVFACVLHELKAKRRATGSTATGPSVLHLLPKDKSELAALERVEHEGAERSARAVQSQVAASPVHRLDALLSARSLPAMIYSAEQVGIQGSRSHRAVWSVAAQLPPPLLSQGAFGSGSGSVAQAAAIKDDKVSRWKLIMRRILEVHALRLKSAAHGATLLLELHAAQMMAKSECAQALLDQLRRINPAQLNECGWTTCPQSVSTELRGSHSGSASSRPTLSAQAAEWAPKPTSMAWSEASSDTAQTSKALSATGSGSDGDLCQEAD